MASFCYRIRSTQKNKLVKIQILFTVGRGNQFYVDSQYMVLTDAWDNKRQTVKSRFTFTDDFTEQQGRELTKNLSELRSHILGEIAKDPEHAMTKTRLEKIIYSFHHPRSLTTGRHARSRESLSDYIARFTREMEEGTRLNIHKLRYGPSTIKNYKGFVVQFDEYCKARRKQFDFADIDLKFYDDFVAWFTAKNYSVNTIGRHVKELKIIMRAAREEGLHDNGAIESRKFRVLTADVENIYLTESEIRAIATLDLSKNRHKDVARDIFLVGCYTAQRFSDYSTINEGNIRTLENGQQVIDLKQQKTGKKLSFKFKPVEFNGATYTVTENIVAYNGDHYMRKYLEISVPEEDKLDAEIDYIDLESLNVTNSKRQWTIPTDQGSIVGTPMERAIIGQPF